MSEAEQDALLDRIEMAQARKLLWSRASAVFAYAAAGTCIMGLMYLALRG
jgi:hypothetical protein